MPTVVNLQEATEMRMEVASHRSVLEAKLETRVEASFFPTTFLRTMVFMGGLLVLGESNRQAQPTRAFPWLHLLLVVRSYASREGMCPHIPNCLNSGPTCSDLTCILRKRQFCSHRGLDDRKVLESYKGRMVLPIYGGWQLRSLVFFCLQLETPTR